MFSNFTNDTHKVHILCFTKIVLIIISLLLIVSSKGELVIIIAKFLPRNAIQAKDNISRVVTQLTQIQHLVGIFSPKNSRMSYKIIVQKYKATNVREKK